MHSIKSVIGLPNAGTAKTREIRGRKSPGDRICYAAYLMRHRRIKISSYDLLPEILNLLRTSSPVRTIAIRDAMVKTANRKRLVYRDSQVRPSLPHAVRLVAELAQSFAFELAVEQPCSGEV